MSRRSEWRSAVSRTAFPVGMRPVKATLLSLPVNADGVMFVWRAEIADTTGLPLRTVDRHLARAVKAGWLAWETHGGHGRRARYTVTVPDEVARQQWQATAPSCAPRSTRNSLGVARHIVANSEKTERAEREHVAVDVPRLGKSAQRHDRGSRCVERIERRGDSTASQQLRAVAASCSVVGSNATLRAVS